MLQVSHKFLQGVEFPLQIRQLLQHSLLRRTIRLQTQLPRAAGHECRTVQLEPSDVEGAGLREAAEAAVVREGEMVQRVVLQWVEQTPVRIWLPEVALELVTGVAAVNEVRCRVRAPSNSRLEVIHGQLGSHVRLMDTAVATPEAVLLPQCLTVHEEADAPPVRIRPNSFWIASSSSLASATVCSSFRISARFR
jgi:hypothetical protein